MKDYSDHVLICGLGHVGYRVACLLLRLGQKVVVVCDGKRPDLARQIQRHCPVIEGDVRDDSVLINAGVQRARTVMALTDVDMTNVEVAVDTRRMNPSARVILRVFDQDLGAHLERAIGIQRALSASAFAAPAFVTAARDRQTRARFHVDGTCFTVEDVTDAAVQQDDATGTTVIDLPRAPDVPDTTSPVVAPGRVRISQTKDAPRAKDGTALRARRSPWLAGVSNALRATWIESPKLLRITLLAILLMVVVSTAVFRVGMQLPLMDALYFSVTVVTTTGFGDYNLQHAPAGMKLFGILLMLSGAALVAILFSLVTDILLRMRLRDLVVRTSSFRGHVIVAGLGNLGFRVLRELAEAGETVVAVELDSQAALLETARSFAPVIIGDAASPEVLSRAGASQARAVIAATSNDVSNLSAVLAVRRVNPSARAVLRVFDARLAEKMQESLSIDSVISMSAAAAPSFAAAALCDDAIRGFTVDGHFGVVFLHTIEWGAKPGPTGSAAAREELLLRSGAGSDWFNPIATGEHLDTGDRVIGIRWYTLADEAAI